jgi:hypothetical protein
VNFKYKQKAKLSIKPAFLFVSTVSLLLLSLLVSANQFVERQLNFDPVSFIFSDSSDVSSVNSFDEASKSKPQYNIAALTLKLANLNTDKAYFELSYGYIKTYGRKFNERIQIQSSLNEVKITSLAPVRSLSIENIEIPAYYFVAMNTAYESQKSLFTHTISKRVLSAFCQNKVNCEIKLTDITGQYFSHSYDASSKNSTLPILGMGFYGLPCTASSFCSAINSQSLSLLSEEIGLKVVDVSNQQLTFNEQILCESGVLKNCQRGLGNNKNTLEWHVMENQVVIQLQEIKKQQRFFQAEVFIAWVNPMMKETRKVTTVFARHKNKQDLVKLLAKKVSAITKVMIYSQS